MAAVTWIRTNPATPITLTPPPLNNSSCRRFARRRLRSPAAILGTPFARRRTMLGTTREQNGNERAPVSCRLPADATACPAEARPGLPRPVSLAHGGRRDPAVLHQRPCESVSINCEAARHPCCLPWPARGCPAPASAAGGMRYSQRGGVRDRVRLVAALGLGPPARARNRSSRNHLDPWQGRSARISRSHRLRRCGRRSPLGLA